jgi:hypothetical protein
MKSSFSTYVSYLASGAVALVTWAACSSQSETDGNSATVAGSTGSGIGSSTTASGGPAGGSGAGGGTVGGSGGGAGGANGTAGAGTGGAGVGGAGGGPANGGANVLQFHRNLSRDGLYVDAAFTKAAAGRIHKDTTFNATIAGATFAQPLYFEGAAGGKNLVIVATMQNQVYALDAASGAVVWQKQAGMPAQGNEFGCGNMATIGITGTPVIDAASKTMFFDAANPGPVRKIHAFSLDDGSERPGWPVDVVASVRSGNIAFDPTIQSQRAAPTLVNGTLYVPYGGIIGDCGNYHGWVAGVPIAAPTQVKAYATVATKSGIWGPGGIASDGTNLFVTTGNAPSGAAFGHQESILRLQAGPAFSTTATDYFTPTNWRALDSGDTDLGGSGPIVVDVPGATPSKLVVALGKDGIIYLVNRENLGGIVAAAGQQGIASATVSSNAIIQAGASYTTAMGTYVVFKGNGSGCPGGTRGDITAVKISATNPPRPTVAWCATQGGPGSPMVTTTDGQAEAVVWGLGTTKLMGFDGDTGAVVFNGGAATDSLTPISNFVTPIAARGRIFVATNSAVHAFTTQ